MNSLRLPKVTPINTYQAARDLLTDYLSKRDDVVALFEIGSSKSPGLSDLDFMVIVSNKPQGDIADYLHISQLPDLVREMMDGGTLIVMRQEDFKQIWVWDDVGLSQLLGDRLLPDDIDRDDYPLIEFCRLLDWLPERLARLIGFSKHELNPIKQAEGTLFSLRYSFILIEKCLKIEDQKLTELLNAILDLRGSWFDDQKASYKRLIELYECAIDVGFDLLISLTDYIQENSLYGNAKPPENARLTLGTGLVFEFSSDSSKNNLIKHSRVIQQGTDMISLPAVYYHHFAIYGLIGGVMGRQILNNLSPPPDNNILYSTDTNLLRVQQKRLNICNSMAEFLSLNGFRHGLFKLGWYYPYSNA